MVQMLREIHPFNTAKLIGADTGLPIRRLERILDLSVRPSFETLVKLLAAYPRLLLALGPTAMWAPLAVAAVEQAYMEAALADNAARP